MKCISCVISLDFINENEHFFSNKINSWIKNQNHNIFVTKINTVISKIGLFKTYSPFYHQESNFLVISTWNSWQSWCIFCFLKSWNAMEWEMLHTQSWVLKPEYQYDYRTSSTNTSTGPSSTKPSSTSTSTTKIVLEYEYFEYFAQLWRESMNRAFHTHGDEMDIHECLSRTFFSSRYPMQFCLSFPLFARYKNKQTRIFIRHSLFTGYFFSLSFRGFFPSMSQYYYLNDIVRIHHIFSLLVQSVKRPLSPPLFTN